MRAVLSAWLWLLLGLLPVEVETNAANGLRHRLTPPKTSRLFHSPYITTIKTSDSDLAVALDNYITRDNRRIIWRILLQKDPPPRFSNFLPSQNEVQLEEEPAETHRSRGRRHVGGGRGHGHLMRVGCVLGTCQVQNLSHRLYQLIGQSGREDSSPINPRSPHSYG
ncbi:protein ADM2 [Synchiropus splendidus]|uniref:protein ADM2 n=1 Tax=Synchiropus splendidus TaxID=270530 RepID=UPI00237ECD01|nr:protein ADM2 [Synchiropus splendidus]